MKHLQVIINPVSGRSKSRGLLQGLRARARADGVRCDLTPTQGPGDAARLAAEACAKGVDVVIVVGGDGTICEVVGGMTNPEVPILVVPGGTENILAKYFGIVAEPGRLWQLLREGRQVTMDTGLMNGRKFLLIAGIGFDAAVVRLVAMNRKGHLSYQHYFWPIWRSLWSYRQPQLYVEADGTRVFEGRGLVFVGSVPRYGMGLRILDRAVPNDGLLDTCILRCSWQGPLLAHAVRVLLRRHLTNAEVIYRQASKIRVWSDEPVDVQLDGDLAGALPADFEVCPVQSRFIVPASFEM